jgi:hypothetical protein
MRRDQNQHSSHQDKDQKEQHGACCIAGYGHFSSSDTIRSMTGRAEIGCSGRQCRLVVVAVLLGSRRPLSSSRHCVAPKREGSVFFTSWIKMLRHIRVHTVVKVRKCVADGRIPYTQYHTHCSHTAYGTYILYKYNMFYRVY